MKTTTTKTPAGRYSVSFVDPVTGKAKRRTFRTERLAGVFARGTEATWNYWAKSATATTVEAYQSGNVVTIVVG